MSLVIVFSFYFYCGFWIRTANCVSTIRETTQIVNFKYKMFIYYNSQLPTFYWIQKTLVLGYLESKQIGFDNKFPPMCLSLLKFSIVFANIRCKRFHLNTHLQDIHKTAETIHRLYIFDDFEMF